jgi:methionine synthase II (cobalamin-independent)
MNNLRGLAIGIGSLPHKNAQEAVDLVLRYLPSIPFWPQLPKRDLREGMLVQFSEHLPCLEVIDGGIFLNPRDLDRNLEKFYEKVIAQDIDYFKISEQFASGLYRLQESLNKSDLTDPALIKTQITGPFTFLAGINDESGRSLLYDPVFKQAIIKGLSMKALWQIGLFKSLHKKVILFIDEPYLGCFGSAYTPLNREDVIGGLTELTDGIKSADTLIGVHCCGNTDWSIFTDLPNIDIINFDAFDFQDKFILYAKDIKKFLERGGVICWGIVPTYMHSLSENVKTLVDRIYRGVDQLEKKGIERRLITDNLLISPSCGLGTLTLIEAENIFKILSEVSLFIRNI